MEKTINGIKVCVTGVTGYIGSWLVKKLLEKGYIVHATLRNLEDLSKVGLLKSLPNAEARLTLFQADIYNPHDFGQAIEGCQCVFHVATPLQHNSQSSQYKDVTEAAVAGVKAIVESCIRSHTVRRLVYTASVFAASPMKDDGSGFKDFIDESCWTPLDLSFAHSNDHLTGYVSSKTLAEKEALSYNDRGKSGAELEVVSLVCGLVGGDTLLPYVSGSQVAILSQLTGNMVGYNTLKLLQEVLGSVPLAHIDDICEAHVFSMEKPSMVGRFLFSNGYLTVEQIANYYHENYPEFKLIEGFEEEQESCIKFDSKKLIEMGFEYKYDFKKILDETVDCARKLGVNMA